MSFSTGPFEVLRLPQLSRHFAAVGVAFCVTACGGSDDGDGSITVANASARCAALTGTTIPSSAIGLPTRGATIASAALQPADGASGNPEYCKVLGDVLAASPDDPSIKFQLNLPTTWNVKTLQFGGGGFNGSVISGLGLITNSPASIKSPLALGYATFGGDSGHQGGNGAFGTNAQALANYGGESVKRTRDVAVRIESSYYEKSPARVYYAGQSKGGHEALIAAQRYGVDFDGVIAQYPANQNQAMVISWYNMWRSAYQVPGGYVNGAKQQLLKSKVMESCDALDGLVDGVVSNVSACDSKFSVATLRCTGGSDLGDGCLSDTQISTLMSGVTPFQFAFPLANGVSSIGPFPVFQGGELNAWMDTTGVGNTGYKAFADGTIRFFIKQDPDSTMDNFDYRDWKPRVEFISRLADATDPNIDAFQAKGGKILMIQGTTDMLVPHSTTSAYFRKLGERYGDRLSNFARYYVVPGFAHGNGDFLSTWDPLTALEDWVERGVAPTNQVTVDAASATKGRARPLCEYPRYPRYNGSGDTNLASSFTCSAR